MILKKLLYALTISTCIFISCNTIEDRGRIKEWTYKSYNYNLFGNLYDSTTYTVKVTDTIKGKKDLYHLSNGDIVSFENGGVDYYRKDNEDYLRIFPNQLKSMLPLLVTTLDGDSTYYDLEILLDNTQAVEGDTIRTFVSRRTLSRDGNTFYQETHSTISRKRGVLEIKSFFEDGSVSSLTTLLSTK